MFNKKAWLKKNKYREAQWIDNYRFGGNRKLVLERDNYSCVKCGMTAEQHKSKYGRDITVDHIDGRGSHSTVKNNSIDNLQTLCYVCHGRKDTGRRSKLNPESAELVRQLYSIDNLSISQIAKRLSICSATVQRVLIGKTWNGQIKTKVIMRPMGSHHKLIDIKCANKLCSKIFLPSQSKVRYCSKSCSNQGRIAK